jgi:hypothetical protein
MRNRLQAGGWQATAPGGWTGILATAQGTVKACAIRGLPGGRHGPSIAGETPMTVFGVDTILRRITAVDGSAGVAQPASLPAAARDAGGHLAMISGEGTANGRNDRDRPGWHRAPYRRQGGRQHHGDAARGRVGHCGDLRRHVFLRNLPHLHRRVLAGSAAQPDEKELLQELVGYDPAKSRLSCQVHFEESLDGLSFEIALDE